MSRICTTLVLEQLECILTRGSMVSLSRIILKMGLLKVLLDLFGDSEGITVIDITKPTSPAYCFVRYRFSRRIYTAARYLNSYYTKRDLATLDDDDNRAAWNNSCEEAVASLRDVPLLSPAVLAETWPSHFEEIRPDPTYKPPPPMVEHAALVRVVVCGLHTSFILTSGNGNRDDWM